jgi:hypothetical protein
MDEFLAENPISSFSNGEPIHYPKLKEYIVKYQDPQQADSIMKIQKELDETKILMKKTIESVLERGEKIDNIVAKSDALSAQSKMFYTQVCQILALTHFTDKFVGQKAEFLLHHHVISIKHDPRFEFLFISGTSFSCWAFCLSHGSGLLNQRGLEVAFHIMLIHLGTDCLLLPLGTIIIPYHIQSNLGGHFSIKHMFSSLVSFKQ